MTVTDSFNFTLSTSKNEDFINKHSTSSLVIATYNAKLIIGYNNWRQQWEFPAGKREHADKDSYDTAQREFFEETHLISENLRLVGLVTISKPNRSTRYRAIFLDNLTYFTPFTQQIGDEMTKLALFPSSELTTLNIDVGDLAIYHRLQKEGLLNVHHPRN